MPKFTATIEIPSFDSELFNKAVIKKLEELMREAAKEFAKSALKRIPVRTGFVAGAFGSLVEMLGPTARLNPVVAHINKVLKKHEDVKKKSKKRNLRPRVEFYYPPSGSPVPKTPTSGRQFATPIDKIIILEANVL